MKTKRRASVFLGLADAGFMTAAVAAMNRTGPAKIDWDMAEFMNDKINIVIKLQYIVNPKD